MDVNKSHIVQCLQQSRYLLLGYGIRQIGLFGSYVRNEQRPDSDIDFLIEFEPEYKTYNNFIAVAEILESLFDHSVEVVTPESLSPYIRPYIMREIEYVSI